MATRSNPRWYTRRVREPGPDIDPSTFQRLEGAEQELGRPLTDDEKRQWLESQPALDPGFVEWHGAPPEEVGNLLPGERVHTADGWWFRGYTGNSAGRYFFKSEAPAGTFARSARENPLRASAPTAGLSSIPAVGTRVRLTGKFLKNTGQHRGAEGQKVWKVLGGSGPFVIVDEDADVSYFTPEELAADPSLKWRRINKANLQIVGAPPKAGDEA